MPDEALTIFSFLSSNNHVLLLPPLLETRTCIVLSFLCVNKHYKKKFYGAYASRVWANPPTGLVGEPAYTRDRWLLNAEKCEQKQIWRVLQNESIGSRILDLGGEVAQQEERWL